MALSPFHEYDRYLLSLETIQQVDARVFVAWYSAIRKQAPNDLEGLFQFVERLEPRGFLSSNENANRWLAADLLLEAWLSVLNYRYFERERLAEKHEGQTKVRERTQKLADELRNLVTNELHSSYFLSGHASTLIDELHSLSDAVGRDIECPPESSFRRFGLYYHNHGGKKNAPGIRSVLAYRLVFIFRKYTSEQSTGIVPGAPMPMTGRPFFRRVADLVNLAFPEQTPMDEEDAKKRIKQTANNRRIDVAYEDWPINPFQAHQGRGIDSPKIIFDLFPEYL